MRLHQILPKIKQIQSDKLPGFVAQSKMSPPARKKYTIADLEKVKAKESAVMILLYEKNKIPHIVFTQRHVYKGAHSGQISLPGGKKDPSDPNLEYTARREMEEEIGLNHYAPELLTELSWLYVPPSNFIIYPFVSHIEEQPNFVPEEKEVKEILEVSLLDLLNRDNQKMYTYHNKEFNVQFDSPSYQVNGKVIWGATAMILSEFLTILEQ